MFSKYPLVAIPLRNGILGGLLGTVLLIFLYFFGRHPFLIPVFMDFRIILLSILIVFSLREFRDYYRDKVLSFWEGMIISLLLTVAFSLMAFLILWLFASLQPKFVSSYVTLTLEQIKTIPAEIIERIGRKEYERNIKALPDTKAIDLAWLYFTQTFIISFF